MQIKIESAVVVNVTIDVVIIIAIILDVLSNKLGHSNDTSIQYTSIFNVFFYLLMFLFQLNCTRLRIYFTGFAISAMRLKKYGRTDGLIHHHTNQWQDRQWTYPVREMQ